MLTSLTPFQSPAVDYTGSRSGTIAYPGEIRVIPEDGHMFSHKPKPVDTWEKEMDLSMRTWMPMHHPMYRDSPQPIHFANLNELYTEDSSYSSTMKYPSNRVKQMYSNIGRGGSGNMFSNAHPVLLYQ